LFIPEPIPRGPGRWKLNVSILSDDIFVDSVKSFWLTWKSRKGSLDSILAWWDLGKEKIKGVAINYCKVKSKTQNMTLMYDGVWRHFVAMVTQTLMKCTPFETNLSLGQQ